MQWNIWYKEDLTNVVNLLKEYNPDIICLQELTINPKADIQHAPAFIAEQLGYQYYHKELPIESTDGGKIMLANGIFSRFPISKKDFAWINQPKGGGGYDDEYRAYVEVELDVNGNHISVGTTHMSYTHKFQPTPNKKAETDALIAQIRQHASRFIFTGDLNALPGSYTINSVEHHMGQVGPDMQAKTWTTKPFSYNGFEETDLNWRLDYVFATKDMQMNSTEIIQTEYSDHLPILTTFTV
jgi:endonuclease/exonuclease/phosphatase family metal-dependent hydrolase